LPVALTLDAERLVAAARTQTGLEDLCDDTLPARLADVMGQLDERLDEPSKSRAAAVAQELLVQRLEFFDDRRRLPIADECIERPIIIFGEARSGTTLLQMLLGCDPSSRLLEFWEVMRPTPPPGISDTTERREQADEDWREILRRVPKWLVSHPYNGMLGRNPPECERLWAMDFRAFPPSAWWSVPIIQWPPLRLPRDDARQYEIHRMMLQHLQYGRPARRWVLKGTGHQQRLAAVLAAYPDAVFVWIHRDPLPAIASRFELLAQIYEGLAGPFDRPGFAAATAETCVENFTAAAESPLADDPRIHHFVYQTFVSDPVSAIRDLYDRADLRFGESFEREMRTWMTENPSDRYGRFTYSIDALGVDIGELDRRLDAYRERFGVPRERPKG
jgi:hypothetical protein